MKRNKKITIDATDAIVVIDMQNDFGDHRGALFVQGVDEEPPLGAVINNCLALCRSPVGVRAGSRDRHPKDGHAEYALFGPHCVDGSWGAEPLGAFREYYARIKATNPWMDLEKGMNPAEFSYSASTSPHWSRHLVSLRNSGIIRVFVCGLAFTHCVGESAIAYAAQGFEVYVVMDATRSVPLPYGDPEKMKRKLRLYGVRMIHMKDIANVAEEKHDA